MFLELEKTTVKVGLWCNEKKTAYTIVKRKKLFSVVTTLNTGKYNFNSIERFKYHRIIITDHIKIAKDAVVRIQTGSKCYYDLTKLLRFTKKTTGKTKNKVERL